METEGKKILVNYLTDIADTLGNTNKAKLTTEEIAIATNKGWNVI